jgi:hypothetical protein
MATPGTLEWWNEEFHKKHNYDMITEGWLRRFDSAHFDASNDAYNKGRIILPNAKWVESWPNLCRLPSEHPAMKKQNKHRGRCPHCGGEL